MGFLDVILNEFIDFLVYCIPTMIIAMPLSGIQFIKIHKQNYDDKKYLYIINKFYKEKGFRIFFRGLIPYVSMNGVSSGIYPLAFLLLVFTLPSINYEFFVYGYNIWPFLLAGFLAFYAGLIETFLTIKLESREILKNKLITKTNMSVFSIFIPIFCRSTLYWLPACICDFIGRVYSIDITLLALISMILGFIAGFITLPFDVYATRKYGNDSKKYNLNKFFIDIHNIGFSKLFAGGLCRCFQIGCFTVATSISNFIKAYLISNGFMF